VIQERHWIASAPCEPVVEQAFEADLPAVEQVAVENLTHALAQFERRIGDGIGRRRFRHGSMSLLKREVAREPALANKNPRTSRGFGFADGR
jgi:hypothetical protein